MGWQGSEVQGENKEGPGQTFCHPTPSPVTLHGPLHLYVPVSLSGLL